MEHAARARQLFLDGCNCAQAVFVAFCDKTGLPEADAMRLASSFGGGMGRLREVCGALTGAFLVAGWLYGYEAPGDDTAKGAHYARIQALAAAFRDRFGSILCRELLPHPDHSPNPTPRTPAFYAERPCAQFVSAAAELLDRYLDEHPVPHLEKV